MVLLAFLPATVEQDNSVNIDWLNRCMVIDLAEKAPVHVFAGAKDFHLDFSSMILSLVQS